MNLSKFVLNKINFESNKLHHPYLDLFQQLVPIQKNSILHDAPHKIRKYISNEITLRTFIQLCIWKQCNIWIIHNNICFHIGSFPPTHIIDQTIQLWSNQLDTYQHVIYPMYAISHYKIEELKTIATNLDIPISKTKKQLYSDIILKID